MLLLYNARARAEHRLPSRMYSSTREQVSRQVTPHFHFPDRRAGFYVTPPIAAPRARYIGRVCRRRTFCRLCLPVASATMAEQRNSGKSPPRRSLRMDSSAGFEESEAFGDVLHPTGLLPVPVTASALPPTPSGSLHVLLPLSTLPLLQPLQPLPTASSSTSIVFHQLHHHCFQLPQRLPRPLTARVRLLPLPPQLRLRISPPSLRHHRCRRRRYITASPSSTRTLQ